MFLLLAAGFLMAASALISEWMGGITRRCRRQKPPSSANSQQHLMSSSKSEEGEEIKVISDADSKLNFRSRPNSTESKDTLEGQIINVTEENIMVHENLDTDNWDSRRSSSIDLDREVREIFEKDIKRRNIIRNDTIDSTEEYREPTASKGTFGDHIKS